MFFTLGLIGFLISLYFTAVYYGYMKGSNALLPKNICSKSSCTSVLATPFARVFKIPNFVLGMMYYVLVMIFSFGGVGWEIILLSWFFVGFSLYLAYVLIVKLKTPCMLCYAAQTINIIIALMLTIP